MDQLAHVLYECMYFIQHQCTMYDIIEVHFTISYKYSMHTAQMILDCGPG